MKARLAARAIAAAVAVALPASAHVDPGVQTRSRADFVAPAPGTYRLERIQSAPDAVLLDRHGRAQRLAQVTRGKVTLLTFFYTYCVDPLGCPFAQETMGALRKRVLATPALSNSVRFVSISLDPANDTPREIDRYAANHCDQPRFEWNVLTARSVAELLPTLEDLGQDVSVETDARGRPTRTLHHMLKVFLIDRSGMVREIYTLAFLNPDVMFNDLVTLAREAGA